MEQVFFLKIVCCGVMSIIHTGDEEAEKYKSEREAENAFEL